MSSLSHDDPAILNHRCIDSVLSQVVRINPAALGDDSHMMGKLFCPTTATSASRKPSLYAIRAGSLFNPILFLPTTHKHAEMFSAARHTALRQARPSCMRPRVIAPLSRDAALARLLSTLAVLEQREGKLNMASLAAVSAAMKLGGEVTGFVAGSNVKAVADEAAKVEGLDKVIYVDNADYDKVC
jgi:hypothetical protein